MDSPLPRPAGFWLRAGAYAIDSALVGIPATLAGAALQAAGASELSTAILSAALGGLYATLLVARNGGRTVGKMAAGVAVVSDAPQGDLGLGRAFLRWAASALSAALAGLGFLIAAFTPGKRALHDYVARTRVVRTKEIPLWREALVVATGVATGLVAFVLLGWILFGPEPRG